MTALLAVIFNLRFHKVTNTNLVFHFGNFLAMRIRTSFRYKAFLGLLHVDMANHESRCRLRCAMRWAIWVERFLRCLTQHSMRKSWNPLESWCRSKEWLWDMAVKEDNDWLSAFFRSNAVFTLLLLILLVVYFGSERSVLHVRYPPGVYLNSALNFAVRLQLLHYDRTS